MIVKLNAFLFLLKFHFLIHLSDKSFRSLVDVAFRYVDGENTLHFLVPVVKTWKPVIMNLKMKQDLLK